MQDQLIPRLQQTYDDLYSRSATAAETEAIVSALIEELEDINDAIENSKNSDLSESLEEIEDLLEAEIIELLKGLPSMSPSPNRTPCFGTDDYGRHSWKHTSVVKS